MSNILRLLHVNLADSANITASTTAGTLVAANLKTNIKSQVWRSTGTSATLTVSLTAAKTFTCCILPFTNFTNTATMRVRGYANLTDVVGVATPTFDTTALTCCAYTATNVFDWDLTVPGVNNFGQGGGVYAGLFFTGGSAIKIVIDIVDTSNSSGYVEAARVVCGAYWSPMINCDWGVNVGFKTSTAHTRNDAGDLITDIRALYKNLSFDFNYATPSDRESIMKLFRMNLDNPVYVSLFPADTDKNLEQDYQIWGKLTQQSNVNLTRYQNYTTSISIDEI